MIRPFIAANGDDEIFAPAFNGASYAAAIFFGGKRP